MTTTSRSDKALPARLLGRLTPPRRLAAGAAVVVLFATGCTSALSAGGENDGEDANGDNGVVAAALESWPEDDPVGTTTSPLFPDVEVGARPIIREADGTATLLLDVDNRSNRDLDLSDLTGRFESSTSNVSIREADGRRRHLPLLADEGCVCSTDTEIPAGSTTTVYATYADVDDEATEYRVNVPGWRPIDAVPASDTEGFAIAPRGTTAMEEEPDRGLAVAGVWRTPEGLLVRVEERNDTADDVSSFDTVTLSDLRAIDIEGRRIARPRFADGDTVVAPKPDDGIPAGRRITRDALVADLPGASEVVITMGGVRRTLPISVGEEPPTTPLAVGTDARSPETASLDTRSMLERGTPLAVTEPDLPGITDEGPRLDYGPTVEDLTSEAQPGWTVSPRSVIRVGDRQSILTFDLGRSGTDQSWPEGLGDVRTGNDLDAIALVDPENQQRISALLGDNRALGNRRDSGVEDGFSRSLYVGYPALADDAESVTVDVPGFGQASDVPVVDLVDAVDDTDATDIVAASTAATYNPGLRIDILDVGPLANNEGTLVRFRAVNDSHPNAVDAPFVDSEGGCQLALVDADTNRRFRALEPCQNTDWSAPLGVGESLEYEVRFPLLPTDVDRVLLEGDTLGAAPPVTVGDEVDPWYLDLPRPADPPAGDTHRGFIGVADDLQTEVASGDEVDLRLDTDVLFEFGSAELTPEARDRVVEVAERLTDRSSGAMTVTGHTDDVGSPGDNLTLSEERAQAVAEVLTDVSGDRFDLTVEGFGDTDPVADNEIDGRDNPDGRARNRRVTITYTAT
ncbi:hypothetical protein BH23ACT2_BH23ACT2_31400 [soil metagenome]